MKKTIYEYTDYKKFLEELILSKPGQGRGFKAKIADAAGCQTAYVSQVFNGNAHFSLEQADAISRLMGLRRDEAGFLLLLVQYARAGTPSLREHLLEQIVERRKRLLNPRSQGAKSQALTTQEQLVYYSNWEYSAVHVLVSLGRMRTPDALASHLGLPIQKVCELLDFLVSAGLLVHERGEYRVGTRTLHLDRDSPMIARHHSNWRFRAIQAVDRSAPDDLHYSSIIAVSRTDAEKLKTMIREFIATTKPLIRESKEESAHAFLIDVFSL